MKTKTVLSIAMVMIMLGAFAQKPSMTLTFTADNNSQHVPLTSILIENLTQGGDTTLYAPDTVLVLDYITGIGVVETHPDNAFIVTQNYPNPMQGKTTVNLYLPENDDVLISVSDIMGREIIKREMRLTQGNHSFAFFPGRESIYFLTARLKHQSRTINMINNPSRSNTAGTCRLEYSGEAKGTGAYKSEIFLKNFAFSLGDQLKFTSFTNLGEQVITSSPLGDQTYYFHYYSNPCPGTPTVTDIDGNVYNTVLVGGQCWMKENLKTTTYKSGTPIPNVIDNSSWTNLTTGAYAWYDNDISWKDSYGALYNWFTTVDTNGLCPDGWHVPSDNEWIALTDHIGGTASPNGNKLKSCRQVSSPIEGNCNTLEHPRWGQDYWHYGTDDYSFSGLPGGVRYHNGPFYDIGYIANWWTSTDLALIYALHRWLYVGGGYVGVHDVPKLFGFSIRCLRDSQGVPEVDFSADPTSGTVPLLVNFTDESLNSPTTWQWSFGDGGTSTLQNPAHTYQTAGNYTVQLTVTNSYGSDTEIKTNYITVTYGGGTGVPCPGMPTVTDIDGNVYNTVLIGTQCWMKENLKTTTYKNGTSIEYPGSNNSAWENNTTGAYAWYNNDITWKNSYGALYNWYAAVNPSGLCPTGWHVPSHNEWTALTTFIGGTSSPNGNKLKSCRQVNSPLGGDCNTSVHPRWDYYSASIYGTDDYGFSGLPGGLRSLFGGFNYIGQYSLWWSSTEYSSDDAWGRYLYYNYGGVSVSSSDKRDGFSVRCLRD